MYNNLGIVQTNKIQDMSRITFKSDKNLYIVQKNEVEIGYIYYDVRKYKSIYSLYIYYIEIFEEYRRQKYGTSVIKYLFDYRQNGKTIMNIYGETASRQAVLWLEYLGANFHSSKHRINLDLENNVAVGFGLNRYKFFKEIAKND